MSTPNLDIEFNYNSINTYYTSKIRVEKPTLPKTVFQTMDELGEHLVALKEEYHIHFPKNFTWSSHVTETIWVFREYAFCLLMLQIGQTMGLVSDRNIPDDMNIKENRFTVIGSQMLTSDIDATIQGPHSAVIIAALEDMFELLTNKYNIPFLKMEVQLYGDFRILSKLYVNVGRFTDEQRYEMLKYAYIGYFRSLNITHGDYVISPLVRRLGYIYLKKLGGTKSLKSILEEAYNEWTASAPRGHLDREQFYLEYEKVERESSLIHGFRSNDSVFVRSLANDIFFSLARANVHRAESYVLPSTAVHIVEIEQIHGDKTEPCAIDKKWFADNVCIGTDVFAYIASAIEQCGYLEYYHPALVDCNKKGVKYFGRLVRGLLHAGLLNSSFIHVYTKLNNFRKSDGHDCPYNVHIMLDKIQKTLAKRTQKTRKALKTI